MPTRWKRSRTLPLAALASGALLLSGCAEFDDTAASQDYQPAPELTPQTGPQPELPEGGGSGEPPASPRKPGEQVPPPQGCVDHDKAVIQTCLDSVTALAAIPGGTSEVSALAGERTSGRVLRISEKSEPQELATLEVDAAGGGGLTGLALSPSYAEDQLAYAYVTTPTDNRVVRVAKGEPPKPVLTGIPRGASGNHGALISDPKGALLVATGDAGDPAASADPNSLAGKVLRIDPFGQPAKDNPTPASPVLASGVHTPGGLCKAPDGSRTWVTDRGSDKDALYRIEPGKPLTTPAWTWPNKPGVAGCSDWSSMVMVATSGAGNVQNLPTGQDGSITGKPQVGADGKNGPSYGKLAGMDMAGDKAALVGTINKDGGKPVSSDDRVAIIAPVAGGPGGGRD